MSRDKPPSPTPSPVKPPAPATLGPVTVTPAPMPGTLAPLPATVAPTPATKQTFAELHAVSNAPAAEPQFAPASREGDLGRLGKYRIQKELGRGGMGAVYLAFDERLQRQIALKVMLPQEAANLLAKERFLREARAAARVNSDYVVSIYEADEIDGVPFIALQYLEGHSLHDAPYKQGPLTIPQIMRVGLETALGLAAAHRIGLVHRDIKPSNLWLEAPNGRVKILDFGLARNHDDNTHLTHTGAVVGTPAYMSPEQGRGLAVDGRSDLFSLGSVLYHMCAGRLPFQGESTMALLMSIGMDEPIPIRELNPKVPPAFASLIHRLLTKDPGQRPPSGQAVADELTALLQSPAGVAAGFAPAPQQPQFRTSAVSIREEPERFAEVIEEDRFPSTPRLPSNPRSASNLPSSPRSANNDIAVSLREAFQPPPQESSRFMWLGAILFALLAAGAAAFLFIQPWGTSGPTNPSDGTPPPRDADRIAAEYVLGIGGTVWVNDSERDIATVAELPQEAFRLTGVNLEGNQRVSEKGLMVFENCTNLTHLAIQSPKVSDAGLAHFKRCKSLTHLAIQSPKVSDTGLAHFKDCPDLTDLMLNLPAMGDTGLANFKMCANLTRLELPGTQVTNDGVKDLLDKRKLTYLNLDKTKVTGVGIDSLRKVLPRCTIIWEGNTLAPK